jgi:hypothetical protein
MHVNLVEGNISRREIRSENLVTKTPSRTRVGYMQHRKVKWVACSTIQKGWDHKSVCNSSTGHSPTWAWVYIDSAFILLVIYWPSIHVLYFQFSLFLAMATCFGICSIPSSGQFYKCLPTSCIMRSCMVCTLRPVLLGWSKQGGWDGRGMWRAWGRWGMHTTFWLGGLKGGDH